MTKDTEFICQLIDVQVNALNIARRKNADYKDSWAEQGLVGILTRIQDKLHRALNISDDGMTAQVIDEKLEDTLVDLANYSLMAIMYKRGYRP